MRTFNLNDSIYTMISDLVEAQYYANNNSYSYSAGYLISVLEDTISQLPKSKQEALLNRFNTERQVVWAKVSQYSLTQSKKSKKVLDFCRGFCIIGTVMIDTENEMIVLEMLFLVSGIVALALIMNPMDID